MRVLRLILKELRHRKFNALLAAAAVTLAVYLGVGFQGIVSAEGTRAATDVVAEERKTNVEDVQLGNDITSAIVNAVKTAKEKGNNSVNGGTVSLHDTYFVVTHFNLLNITIGLVLLANIIGALYLYRKKSRQ